MKIAIFGGAFNPVHNEHVNLVKSAIENLSLDKVIILPSRISPHKSGKITALEQDRLKMCQIAFSQIKEAEVSDYEILREGISYSYISCEHFKSIYPNDTLYFIVGGDMLEYFPKWKYPQRILDSVTLAACARESGESFLNSVQNFKTEFNAPLKTFGYVGKRVSSTNVRTLAALGESISGFVPPQVEEYIIKNSVYLQNNLVEVKKFLKPERWQHTVRVALLAVKNASRIAETELTVLTAAALHDCAKYLPINSEYLKDFSPPPNVPDAVIHQFSGAYMAVNYFKVKDENVINAIKYHTSARPAMSNLEKLIFLSDMLEEGRAFAGVQNLRTLFKKDINGCMKAALKQQIDYLNSTGEPVYELTLTAYKYLKGE